MLQASAATGGMAPASEWRTPKTQLHSSDTIVKLKKTLRHALCLVWTSLLPSTKSVCVTEMANLTATKMVVGMEVVVVQEQSQAKRNRLDYPVICIFKRQTSPFTFAGAI